MAKRGPMTEEQKLAAAEKARASQARFDATVAAMPPLTAATIHPDGAINLLAAFWREIRVSLALGSTNTRNWVERRLGTFDAWCAIGNQDPETVQAFLLTKVWLNRDYAPKGPIR